MEARICIPTMQIFPCNNLLVSVNESPDTDVYVFVLVFFITLMLLSKIIFKNLLYLMNLKVNPLPFHMQIPLIVEV